MQIRLPMRKPRTDAPPQPPPADAPRLRSWLLGTAVALWVCRPLWASEGAALYGDGLPVVMLWIALLAGWLLGGFGNRGAGRLGIRFGGIDAAMLVLVALCAVSAALGAAQGNPRPAVNMLWEWVGLGLAFFCARQWIADGREARAVLAAMIGLSLTLALYGLYQHWYELPQTRAAYAANPDDALRSVGVWFAPGSPERHLFESRLKSDEPLATFALTNSLAGLLAAWLIVALGIVLVSGLRTAAIAAALAAAPMGLCLVLTRSRSAYLAVFAGLAGLVLLRWGRLLNARRAALAVAALAAAAGAAIAAVWLLDRDLTAGAARSLGYRLQYWQASWQMIADHPLAGCGPGNFQDEYTRYKLPGASEEVADPHNFLFEVWATAGTPAALALVVLLAGAACRVARIRHRRCAGKSAQSEIRAAGASCQAAPGSVLAGAMAAYPLAALASIAAPSPPPYGLLLVGAGLTLAVFWALGAWIRAGNLPAALPALGAGVLLIHLLAAGGISYPGVAGSLWLLVAVALNLADADRPRSVGWPGQLALLVVALGLAVACLVTGYGPVLRAQAALLEAERAPAGSARQVEDLQRAAAADPWSPVALERLADLEFRAWLDSGKPDELRQFRAYREQAMALMPRSSAAWLNTGDYDLEAYRRTGGRGHAERAVEAYSRAVELYPASARTRAKLALGLEALGDAPGFRREAAKALELDGQTPHADKKLPDTLRKTLQLKLKT